MNYKLDRAIIPVRIEKKFVPKRCDKCELGKEIVYGDAGIFPYVYNKDVRFKGVYICNSCIK